MMFDGLFFFWSFGFGGGGGCYPGQVEVYWNWRGVFFMSGYI